MYCVRAPCFPVKSEWGKALRALEMRPETARTEPCTGRVLVTEMKVPIEGGWRAKRVVASSRVITACSGAFSIQFRQTRL